MTKQLQLIREKCIAANPEVVKVDVGCEVIVGDLRHTIYEVSREGVYAAYLNRPFPSDLEANDFYDCEFSGETKDLQIIGRPIRLADVLLAAEAKTDYGDRDLKVYLHYSFHEVVIQWGRIDIRWVLRSDDLEKQSEETINFLYELLK